MESRLTSPGATNDEEWDRLWKNQLPVPIRLGWRMKRCVEYKVDDFAAEQVSSRYPCLPINAIDPGYAMFTSPAGDFTSL
jgi:hypothetical protein